MWHVVIGCFYCFLEAQIAGKGIGGRPNSDQSSRIHATHFARTATDSALQFLRTQDMYNNNVGSQGGVGVGIGVGVGPGMGPAANPQPNNPFGNAFYGAGSGLIRGGLGAYGEKILGSSSEYVQSNISRYFSDPQYYFQVNDHYVRNKLKVVLFPFLHRGHWTRITEPVGGRLSYKPPIYDINAPDLYIPFMAFGTYVILAGLSLGLRGKETDGKLLVEELGFRNSSLGEYNELAELDKSLGSKSKSWFRGGIWRGGGVSSFIQPWVWGNRAPGLVGSLVVVCVSFGLMFTPEALNWLFIKGLVGWCLQVSLLKVSLLSLGSGEAPLLDIVAYAGYTFTGMCLAVFGRIAWSYSYYFLMPWACLCMGIFLVKTMKRVLFAEVRSYDSSRHHYLLLFIALAQLPLFIWLGNISVHWLF
ncbi:Protein YIF1B [Vitis vinifera]|uniref:Protein YIF1B n=1 Tax=Vitis vinifera TaxID=29760 RepID=A0A438I5F5_VITVI|nr:Protein YIF1B [Vitis vinifera]